MWPVMGAAPARSAAALLRSRVLIFRTCQTWAQLSPLKYESEPAQGGRCHHGRATLFPSYPLIQHHRQQDRHQRRKQSHAKPWRECFPWRCLGKAAATEGVALSLWKACSQLWHLKQRRKWQKTLQDLGWAAKGSSTSTSSNSSSMMH